MSIVVTPELLRTTSDAITAHMETAQAIARGYLGNQENVMSSATWSGQAVNASHATATQLTSDLQKVLTGGTRLAEGLKAAAALMESHEADSTHAFQGLFGAGAQTV
ncbi:MULTISPECIES: WXG100 family type VII secretion target [Mycolicibacterium]|uniref:Esat-6 like protein esxD n=1 Tax=Mycolicibacterium novocastrense TaxID=59813 RepID=A0ABQ0KDK7_MYCNV|nr:Esat-6 like protein esxD [Mycolicibacterium novocastrense]